MHAQNDAEARVLHKHSSSPEVKKPLPNTEQGLFPQGGRTGIREEIEKGHAWIDIATETLSRHEPEYDYSSLFLMS